MAFRYLTTAPTTVDISAWAWNNSVQANAGTVSATRLATVSVFARAEKGATLWAITDDYWAFWGEGQPQALTSLKQRRLAVSVNSPTFTANQGYTGDGLSAYVALGFVPSVAAIAMTGGIGRAESYVRTNQQSTAPSIGVNSSGQVRLFPRNASNAISAAIMAGAAASAASVTDCRGLCGSERNNTTTVDFDLNGTVLTAGITATPNPTLPTREFYLLANNNAGSAATFFPGQVGYASTGAPLVSPTLKAARYANVQQFATSVGANV